MSDLKVLLVGASPRTRDCLLPTFRAMDGVEVVGIYNRTREKGEAFGRAHGLAVFDDLAEAKEKTGADIAGLGVNSGANGVVGIQCAELGMHLLLETPIALDLDEADRIIEVCASNGLKIEVAEQFHRRPEEQIKLACIREGVFGRIHCAWNDHLGHGYHGVSMIRAFIGFDEPIDWVVGHTPEYGLADPKEPKEFCEYGTIGFAGGQTGMHLWSSPCYMATARGLSGGRIFGEKGSWQSVWDGKKHNHFVRLVGVDHTGAVTIERETHESGVLSKVLARFHDGSGRVIEWDNPWRDRMIELGIDWTDDNIAVAGCVRSLVEAVRDGGEPTYGPQQARLDQAVTSAIWESSKAGGIRVRPK